MRTHLVIAALALAGTMASGQQLPSYDIANDAPPADARDFVERAYGRLPLIFSRGTDDEDGGERWFGLTGHQGVAIDRSGFVLAHRASRADASVAQRAFTFVGANAHARIEGVDPQPARIHHIGRRVGTRDEIDRPTFGRVRLSDLYAGIDVVFYGTSGRVEYDVVVAPGADPGAFTLRASGARPELDDDGGLLLADATGTLRLHRPIAYQLQGDRKAPVDSAFAIAANGDVRFRVGAYDPTRTLVIDPVASYATYLGGNGFEQGTAIAVDAAGNAYIAGYTLSTDFPTVSAYDRSLGKSGDVDVFVTKLNPAGSALVWSTYIGGAGSVDRAIGIAVDSSGSAYVTGSTASNNFPVSASAWQKPTSGGGTFVTKLTPSGNALAYSTYVGGVTSNAIAVDRDGNAYVAGSATPLFATTASALQARPGNAQATGFVLKLNGTGSAPLYATFLGGSGTDEATSVAVDAAGAAFIGGWTASTDFPSVNPIQREPRGQKDAFVAKLDPTGSRLVYATRLGGSLDDAINAIAVDAGGNAYVAGETYSADFPAKGAFQPVKAGMRLINSSTGSAFVAKLSARGNALVYSSFLGGEVCQTPCQVAFGSLPQYRADAAYGIAVDAAGHAYVAGIARSYTFPLVDSTSARKQDDTDDSAFVVKVGASGTSLLWSTFLRTGFNEADNRWTRFPPGAATGIAVDSTGAAYVTGDADSFSDFRPTAGAFQRTNSNNQGAVIVKIAGAPSMTLSTSAASVDAQAPLTLKATLAGPDASGDVVFLANGASLGSAAFVGTTSTLTTTLPAGIHTLTAVSRILAGTIDTPVVYQVVEPPLVCN
jgi:hypothetical protein